MDFWTPLRFLNYVERYAELFLQNPKESAEF